MYSQPHSISLPPFSSIFLCVNIHICLLDVKTGRANAKTNAWKINGLHAIARKKANCTLYRSAKRRHDCELSYYFWLYNDVNLREKLLPRIFSVLVVFFRVVIHIHARAFVNQMWVYVRFHDLWMDCIRNVPSLRNEGDALYAMHRH